MRTQVITLFFYVTVFHEKAPGLYAYFFLNYCLNVWVHARTPRKHTAIHITYLRCFSFPKLIFPKLIAAWWYPHLLCMMFSFRYFGWCRISSVLCTDVFAYPVDFTPYAIQPLILIQDNKPMIMYVFIVSR